MNIFKNHETHKPTMWDWWCFSNILSLTCLIQLVIMLLCKNMPNKFSFPRCHKSYCFVVVRFLCTLWLFIVSFTFIAISSESCDWIFGTTTLTFRGVYLGLYWLHAYKSRGVVIPLLCRVFSFTMQCPNLWSRKTNFSKRCPHEHSHSNPS